MKPFDILRELTKAEDAWVFMLIGFVIAVAAGLMFYRQKIRLIRACVSLGVYIVCELLMDFRVAGGISGAYFAFVIGLIGLGSAAGFAASAVTGKITGKKDRFISWEENI